MLQNIKTFTGFHTCCHSLSSTLFFFFSISFYSNRFNLSSWVKSQDKIKGSWRECLLPVFESRMLLWDMDRLWGWSGFIVADLDCFYWSAMIYSLFRKESWSWISFLILNLQFKEVLIIEHFFVFLFQFSQLCYVNNPTGFLCRTHLQKHTQITSLTLYYTQ